MRGLQAMRRYPRGARLLRHRAVAVIIQASCRSRAYLQTYKHIHVSEFFNPAGSHISTLQEVPAAGRDRERPASPQERKCCAARLSAVARGCRRHPGRLAGPHCACFGCASPQRCDRRASALAGPPRPPARPSGSGKVALCIPGGSERTSSPA